MGKRLFSSSNDQFRQISEPAPRDDSLRCLILDAVLCIDMALKER